MRVPLSILVTALMRSNKKKAVDARDFIVDALQQLGRTEMEVDFSRVTGDTFDMMLNIFEYESWDLKVQAQAGTELSVRPVSISFHGKH